MRREILHLHAHVQFYSLFIFIYFVMFLNLLTVSILGGKERFSGQLSQKVKNKGSIKETQYIEFKSRNKALEPSVFLKQE